VAHLEGTELWGARQNTINNEQKEEFLPFLLPLRAYSAPNECLPAQKTADNFSNSLEMPK
jgi:hypothetical protein